MPAEIRVDWDKMPEVRNDPLTGRSVLIVPQRSRIQKRMGPVCGYPSGLPRFEPTCVFCPGDEERTPLTLISYPEGRPWEVIGFANIAPRQMIEERTLKSIGSPFLDKLRQPAIGAHEIIVPTPFHNACLSSLSEENISAAFWAILRRYSELKRDPRFRSFYLFMNYGERAGASITHLHFQLETHSVTPNILTARFQKMIAHHQDFGECLMERILEEEEKIGGIVYESNQFIAFVPFAPRELFNVIIAPKSHYFSFAHQLTDEMVRIEFAFVLKMVLGKIKRALQGEESEGLRGLTDPPFLFLLFTAPFDEGESSFHWYCEFLPTVTYNSGHEIGLDEDVIPADPLEMAKELREAIVEACPLSALS